VNTGGTVRTFAGAPGGRRGPPRGLRDREGGSVVDWLRRLDKARLAQLGAVGFVFAFLYVPMVVIGLLSVNDNVVGALPFKGLTLHWYADALANSDVIDALRNSVLVALSAVAIAVLLGVPGALVVDRFSFPGKAIFRRFVLLPLILPGVITGVGFLSLFHLLDVRLSLGTVILAHGTALVSTVLTTVYARLLRMDRSMEEASRDLGASALQTFWRVTLPNIRTAIVAAGLLAFTLSMDEIPVTFFVIGQENTLPMYIWSTLRRGFTPEINAVSTLILLLGIGAVMLFARLMEQADAETVGNPVVVDVTGR
jgi:spermidine/putrescine transport system permease protein